MRRARPHHPDSLFFSVAAAVATRKLHRRVESAATLGFRGHVVNLTVGTGLIQPLLKNWLESERLRRVDFSPSCTVGKSAAVGRVGVWRGGCRPNISVAAPHMGEIRSRGFVPSFSPFVSDPKFEPSVIRPGLPVLVSTSHTVAARRCRTNTRRTGRQRAQEDDTDL